MEHVSVDGFASNSSGRINKWTFDHDFEPTKTEVLIEVTHCAVGRGDVDFIDRRFSTEPFIVPGHEIVGIVVACGSDVTTVSPGSRVGVGYQVSSCGTCAHCVDGREHQCRSQECLITDRPGGFAAVVKADEAFVVRIPQRLPGAEAAPLMSTGLTAYSAVQAADIQPAMEIAVAGVGGMGHVASQLIHSLGARVTALTSKQLPEQRWSEVGVTTSLDIADFLDHPPLDRFDQLFVTSGMLDNLDPLLDALTPNGKLVLLGSPTNAVKFSVFKLNDFSSRSIQGSYVGTMSELRDLLDTAAGGNLHVDVSVMAFDAAAQAVDIVRTNSGSFRVVLERGAIL